jgi:hypothetical protein
LGNPQKKAREMMCASSRYGGEAQGSDKTSRSVPRTLIASDPAFEVGANLAEAASRDGGMFAGWCRQVLPALLRAVLRAGRRQLRGASVRRP